MLMTKKVCLIHWCTGTGHAARIIPVAKEFESRDIEVAVAGGGYGSRFLEMNGFEEPGFTEVPDIAEYSLKGLIPGVITDFVPSAVSRTRQLYGWIKEENPDEIVTDDVFAMIAAVLNGKSFYRIDHLIPEILPLKWRVPQKLYNMTSMLFGEKIIVTSLWPDEQGHDGLDLVGPLGQEGETEGIDNYDVLLSPGQWGGEEFQEVRSELEDRDYELRVVGGENWETKPTMTPYIEAADCVICAGYSSIADSVVAGTTCIVYPFLPFQKGIADGIDERGIEGVKTVRSVNEAVETISACVDESCESPDYSNGAGDFVDKVLE